MPANTAEPIHLVADIGGSSARFALVRGADAPLQYEQTLPSIDFATLAEALRHYLGQCGTPHIAAAAIAIASPVTGDLVKMTNHHWTFSVEETRRGLGFERLLLLNDLTALALALPTLPRSELRQAGGGEPVADAALALIGAGTGLGVSGLFPAGGTRWIPIAGEGGHATLAAGNEREAAIIAVCRERYGHVSAERLLSGMGLANIHWALATLAGGATPLALAPAEITHRGVAGSDALCAETLDIFCALLGSVAGNLALTLGARGGVYIGGGIVPKLGDYFHQSAFRARFEGKGRFADYLKPVPVYVIHAQNAALHGAAIALTES